MKQWTTRTFREFSINKYPNLKDMPKYLRFFQYLCFGTLYDKKTKKLMLPHKMMFHIVENKPISLFDHHTANFKFFLEHFIQNVLPDFRWIAATKKTCRQVDISGFDAEFQKVLNKEINIRFDTTEDIVYWQTGNIVNSRDSSRLAEAEIAFHSDLLEEIPVNETQKMILDHLHSMNPRSAANTFVRKLNENYDRIISKMNEMELSGDLTPNSVKIQKRILASIPLQPKPLYKPSEKNGTCRISNCNDSFISLKRELRKVACSGWTEADLVSSQFAIAAFIFEATIAKEFIKSGKNLWKEFHLWTHFKDEKPPQNLKKAYKEVIYAICFGKSIEHKSWQKAQPNTEDDLLTILHSNRIDELIKHPIIIEFLELRERWYSKIKFDKGATDVFGKFHPIKSKENPNGRRINQVGATIIQAYEMAIISPIFTITKENGYSDQFNMVLWQHDGATFSFRSSARKEAAKLKLKKAVEDKAAEFGITTTMEFEDLI